MSKEASLVILLGLLVALVEASTAREDIVCSKPRRGLYGTLTAIPIYYAYYKIMLAQQKGGKTIKRGGPLRVILGVLVRLVVTALEITNFVLTLTHCTVGWTLALGSLAMLSLVALSMGKRWFKSDFQGYLMATKEESTDMSWINTAKLTLTPFELMEKWMRSNVNNMQDLEHGRGAGGVCRWFGKGVLGMFKMFYLPVHWREITLSDELTLMERTAYQLLRLEVVYARYFEHYGTILAIGSFTSALVLYSIALWTINTARIIIIVWIVIFGVLGFYLWLKNGCKSGDDDEGINPCCCCWPLEWFYLGSGYLWQLTSLIFIWLNAVAANDYIGVDLKKTLGDAVQLGEGVGGILGNIF